MIRVLLDDGRHGPLFLLRGSLLLTHLDFAKSIIKFIHLRLLFGLFEFFLLLFSRLEGFSLRIVSKLSEVLLFTSQSLDGVFQHPGRLFLIQLDSLHVSADSKQGCYDCELH